MKHQKKILPVIFSLFFAPMLFANPLAGAFTGKVAMLSNYILRGVSQTQNDPAVQGDIAYRMKNGFYLGLWASNVDFGATDPAHVEFDPYVGFFHQFNKDWGVNAMLTRYVYPSAHAYNYTEMWLFITYKFLTATFAYSVDNNASDTVSSYYGIEAKHALFDYLKRKYLKGIYGFVGVGYSNKSRRVDGGTYYDYKFGVGKKVMGIDTEIGMTQTSGRSVKNKLNCTHTYFSIAKEFG